MEVSTGEGEDEDDSRDIGGIWQVSSGRKAKTQTSMGINPSGGKEWNGKYQGIWTPIEDQEESDAGNINAVDPAEGEVSEALRITVDSGAVDTVGPKSLAPGLPTQDTEASRKGMYYRAANDTKIAIHGKKDISGYTNEGSAIGLEIQKADVKKALGSVRKMFEAGNRVVFDDAGSCVENKETGERTALTKERGSYILTVWAPSHRNRTRESNRNSPPPQAGILGVDTPDPVRPQGQSAGTHTATGSEAEPNQSPEHQNEAFWKALEPFGPDEASDQAAERALDSEAVGEDEPGNEEEWSGASAKVSAIPRASTKKDLEEPLITHWPCRNWCDHCVRGRGKSGHHREVRREASVPTIGIDYMWMTSGDDDDDRESLRGMPILVLADQESGWVSA